MQLDKICGKNRNLEHNLVNILYFIGVITLT